MYASIFIVSSEMFTRYFVIFLTVHTPCKSVECPGKCKEGEKSLNLRIDNHCHSHRQQEHPGSCTSSPATGRVVTAVPWALAILIPDSLLPRAVEKLLVRFLVIWGSSG